MAPTPDTFETLLAEVKKTADATIGSIGERFDFSLASIDLLDSFVDGVDFSDDDKDTKLYNLAESIGAYIGEVVRRHGLGEWIASASEPEYKTESPLLVRTPKSIFDPFNWALKRLVNGPEDNLLLKFDFMVLKDRDLNFRAFNKKPKKEKGFWGRFFEWPEDMI